MLCRSLRAGEMPTCTSSKLAVPARPEPRILPVMRCGLLLTLALLTAGCGTAHRPTPPATLPAGAVPSLTNRERELQASTLVAEALDHATLHRLLDHGGYVTGNEREFYGRSPVFSHVIARVLRFRRPEGASAYLAWAQRHAVDTVGALRSKRRLLIGEAGVVVVPKGCGCHGETPTFLAIWQHADLALWLLASGPGVSDRRVDALAGRLDRLAGA